MRADQNTKNAMPAVDHSGHRKRLRKRAQTEGIENFEMHNLLELLLFYTIPRADTNELGHRLLDYFGSFSAVLDAQPQELMQVHGVGPETAQFLSLLPTVFRIYMNEKSEPVKKINDIEEVMDVFVPHFVGQKKEMLYMVCIQAGNKVGKCICLAEGTGSEVDIDTRRIVLEAINANAIGVVLAHNHPSGNAKPSTADRIATVRIANALNAVDIPLLEHFVYVDGRYTALSEDVRFVSYFGDAFRSNTPSHLPLSQEPASEK